MIKPIPIIWILITLKYLSAYTQDLDYFNQALDEFKNENYISAIDLLKKAESRDPTNPDIYYYLGYFCHYLAYDSRPMKNYNMEWSDLVLEYLNKAIALKPDYGDAYYFLGAEYGARARNALFNKDIEKCKQEYSQGRELGGNPDWLLEIGRNILKSCEPNAILFTAGDADINAIHYLQFVENYRRDVSAFPSALLERPWFVLLMKEGIPDYIPGVPISWSEFEILNMHPYKWKTNTVNIPFSQENYSEYNIHPEDTVMNLKIEADLNQDTRSFLDPGQALLIDIIESNNWERTIHFSAFANYNDEFKKHFQLSGLTYKLMPFDTEKYGTLIDVNTTEEILLNPNNYKGLKSFPDNDMPRASNLLQGYRWIIIQLAEYYFKNNNDEKGNYILEKMNEYIPKHIVPYPDYYTDWIEKIKK
jgi:hypothetical protein